MPPTADDRVTTDATELLRTLIRNACVNDGTVESGQEVRTVEALEDYFAGSGLTFERDPAAPGRVSLITRIEGRDRQAPTLLLMGHTDVVPANPAGWTRDPFGAELVDGIVWGRGAIDMLNITATMAVATRRLAASGFRPRGTLVYPALVPGSRLIPRLTTGATDARFFRWKGVPAYGFGLHSPRIPYTEYPLMFHGNDERVDVDSLRLSTLMWEALCRDFLG